MQDSTKKAQEQIELITGNRSFRPRMTATNSHTSAMLFLVNKCIDTEVKGNITELQQYLYKLYKTYCMPGSGKYIVTFEEKDNLALCFAFLLHYDWLQDEEIRNSCATSGFYCILEFIDHQSGGKNGFTVAMVILFILLCVGHESLKPAIQRIVDSKKNRKKTVFDENDFSIGAQNVIDQFAYLCVKNIKSLGAEGNEIMMNISQKYNGKALFQIVMDRTELSSCSDEEILSKARYIRDVIASEL